MITALYQMGKYYESNKQKSELMEIVENPNETGNYNNVIVLEFESQGKEIIYKGFRLEEFSEAKLEKYLYKTKVGGNSGDYTPTSKVTEFEKTIKNFLKSLKNIKKEEFQKIYNYLKEELEENKKKLEDRKIAEKTLVEKLKEKYNAKDGYILTLNLDGKTLNDFPEIVNLLFEEDIKRYYEKYSKISKNKNKECFSCKSTNEEVYGFVNTFQFYTLDKRSFVTGGFQQKNSWKNYPICKNCAKTLEKGKKYLESNLKSYFAGFNYFIVPKFIFPIDKEENFKIYSRILKSLSNKDDIKISLSENKEEYLIDKENKILKYLSKTDNNMNYNIMFFEEKQSGSVFNILKNIEDVLPSRLNKLFKVKEKIENHKIFEPILITDKKGKEFLKEYYFNFETVRKFFPSSKIDGVFDDSFLEIVNSIFIDKKIDEKFMISAFVRTIRNSFINPDKKEYEIEDLVKRSLLIYKFLVELDLFNNFKKGEVKAMIEKNEKNERYLDFFDEHSEVFDSDLKRGVFLVGVLVNKLLSLPEQGNKPFYSRLNSLKMDEKMVKRIVVEAINKLNEYGKNYYMELEKLISEYLTLSNFKELSKEELSYYFVTGMNLGKIFKNQKKEESEENE